jgi:hypothetical protein
VNAILERLQGGDKQTLGHLSLFKGKEEIFECVTLELADRGNRIRISRIPSGEYLVRPRWSKKYGDHYEVVDVHGRTYILIHNGNYYTDTVGCILVGAGFRDLNKDNLLDVTSSVVTLGNLLKMAPKGFKLVIKNYNEVLPCHEKSI